MASRVDELGIGLCPMVRIWSGQPTALNTQGI
jgi:hypothetical protein